MPARIPSRSTDLRHHVVQGAAWLQQSDHGTNTTALSYAAFEFRLAIERLAVHYWTQLLGRRPEAEDLHDIRSFKRIEQRIYALGGHQREINGHFEFMQFVLNLLEIKDALVTPNLGRLTDHWHRCSELCHIGWTLSCTVPQLRTDAFETLQEIQASLTEQVRNFASWPEIHDSGFAELRNSFVAEKVNSEDVRVFLERTGVWVRAKYEDGRPSEFLGEAIPPSKGTEST